MDRHRRRRSCSDENRCQAARRHNLRWRNEAERWRYDDELNHGVIGACFGGRQTSCWRRRVRVSVLRQVVLSSVRAEDSCSHSHRLQAAAVLRLSAGVRWSEQPQQTCPSARRPHTASRRRGLRHGACAVQVSATFNLKLPDRRYCVKTTQARITRSSLWLQQGLYFILTKFRATGCRGSPRTRASKKGTPLKNVILSLLARIVWKRLQIRTDMLFIITSTALVTGFLDLSTSITMNDLEFQKRGF